MVHVSVPVAVPPTELMTQTLVGVLLAPRLLSPFLARGEAGNAGEFGAWMAAVLVVLVFACFNLGKNLSGVTALRSRSGEDSPRVIRGIGVPMLLIGISCASGLGYLGIALAGLVPGPGQVAPTDARTWAAAAVVGALFNLITWLLARTAARVYGPWGEIERAFWKHIVGYSPVSTFAEYSGISRVSRRRMWLAERFSDAAWMSVAMVSIVLSATSESRARRIFG